MPTSPSARRQSCRRSRHDAHNPPGLRCSSSRTAAHRRQNRPAMPFDNERAMKIRRFMLADPRPRQLVVRPRRRHQPRNFDRNARRTPTSPSSSNRHRQRRANAEGRQAPRVRVMLLVDGMPASGEVGGTVRQIAACVASLRQTHRRVLRTYGPQASRADAARKPPPPACVGSGRQPRSSRRG